VTAVTFNKKVGIYIFLKNQGYRWQVEALEAIQQATEAYLVHLFEDA
jgi:histone H3/H4